MEHLEENLRNKSKQLNQRIEQVFCHLLIIWELIKFLLFKIKEMNEAIDDMKQQKEEAEDKIRKFEDMLKCQKLEIDTKNSMIKKLELVS